MYLKGVTSENIYRIIMGIVYIGVGFFILVYSKFLELNILQKIVFGSVLLIYGLFRLYRAIKLKREEQTVDKYENEGKDE